MGLRVLKWPFLHLAPAPVDAIREHGRRTIPDLVNRTLWPRQNTARHVPARPFASISGGIHRRRPLLTGRSRAVLLSICAFMLFFVGWRLIFSSLDLLPSSEHGSCLLYGANRFISPGINRISLKLQPRTAASTASAPVPSSESLTTPPRQTEMFDEFGLPLPNIYIPLLDTFFRTMSLHFPSISRKRMEERLETGTMSAFLLNCTHFFGGLYR